MQQSDGTDLLGANDPRSTTIGIIDVAPDDDRQSVLAAILTQEKLGRKQVVVVLPEQNKAFQRPIDFDGLKDMRSSLKAEIVFVAHQGPGPAEFARQRRFPVYFSLEDYAAELQNEDIASSPAKGGWLSLPWQKPSDAPPPATVEDTETSPLPSHAPEQEPDNAEPVLTTPENAEPPETTPEMSGVPQPYAAHQPSGPVVDGAAPLIPVRRNSPSGTPRRRAWRGLLVAIVLLLLILLGGVVLASTGLLQGLGVVVPGLASAATVTITPASTDLKNTYVISAVVGTPDPSQRQVAARILASISPAQLKTVRATGVGHVPGVQAKGGLTFYNAYPRPQIVPVGTVLTDANGVQVVNDEVAQIPAATPPAEGSVTVAAHAVNAGRSGNIPAFDFNSVPCCTDGVTVQNAAAFSGGQDQLDYAFVQQSDIDGVANPLQTSLTQTAQAALKTQLLPNEQFVSLDHCSPAISSDHQAGDKATSVTVTVVVTCTNEAYDQRGTQTMAAKLLSDQALTNPGAGYMLVGNVMTVVTEVKVTDASKGTIAVSVSAEGVWVYQFSNVQKQELTKLIASKSKQDAQFLLLQQTGVMKADIQLSWINGNTLPMDAGQIKIVVQRVPGVHSSIAPTT